MVGIRCRLICNSASEHLNQLYTGFGELDHQGLIQASFEKGSDYLSNSYLKPYLKVIVNEQFTLLYDNSDSHELIFPDLGDIDFCFKRSFLPSYIESLKDHHKIFPLGFNYEVYSKYDGASRRAFWSNNFKDFLKAYVRSNYWLSKILKVEGSIGTSHIKKFEGKPLVTDEPKVLFMARLWDPAKVRTTGAKEEREKINYTRATCIRELRKEFGERFIGGLSDTDLAKKHFPDCVIKSKDITRKSNYLKLMHSASVCIATAGLTGSVGWKMGEYVAGAKAIVSEKNNYAFPGDFAEGKNFLSFETSEECLNQVACLIDNPDKRRQMMEANQTYYQDYLHPPRLVLNSLKHVLSLHPGNQILK